MKRKQFVNGVYWMGAVDWDRRLFDALIPTPDGTSYNSWLVTGSKATVLFDTVDPHKCEFLLDQLSDVSRIDYIVTHHAEQDHSGALPVVMAKYPEAIVLCTPRCQKMLLKLMPIAADRIRAVEDGETLDIGGRTLKFIHMPWVHWPETMVTWMQEDGILFSCDLFGSHLATSKLTEPWDLVMEPAKRYYAEIMMPFRAKIAGYLDQLQQLDIKMICPSHGPMHDHPADVMNAYREWVSGKPRNTVVIAYVSMHGSTQAMVDALVSNLTELDIQVRPFNLVETDLGKLAEAIVDAATIIVASPTVLAGAHPLAISATCVVGLLKPKTAFIGIMGSYSWGGKMVEQLLSLIPHLKAEPFEPLLVEGYPDADAFERIRALAALIQERHKNAGII
jgi:flavorubredoxin